MDRVLEHIYPQKVFTSSIHFNLDIILGTSGRYFKIDFFLEILGISRNLDLNPSNCASAA